MRFQLPRCWLPFATALLLAGCSKATGDATVARKPSRVSVTAAVAQTRDVPIRLSGIGTVEPVASVSIRPQVSGVLAEAAFTEGQEVRKGDLLFRIDDRPQQAALHQAEAALARDQALYDAAARDAVRNQELASKGFVSAGDRDKAIADAGSLKASLAIDRAAVEAARLQLSYCTIRSPIDGRTGPILVQPGNVVTANQSILVTVLQQRPIRVAFPVPEARLPEVRAGMADTPLAVEVRPQGDDGPPIRGRLAFLGNEVDRATGTVLLKALFDNDHGRLWPGQFVRVQLHLGIQAGATVVPSDALQDGQQGTYAFVVKPDGTADLRNVIAGISDDGDTVVVDGIAAGETVVTDGQLRLTPGAAVEVRR